MNNSGDKGHEVSPSTDGALKGADLHAPMSFGGFVLTLAGLMVINALAIDIMLPAFPQIASALSTDTTTIQAVITTYMLGFGASQLFIGFLADRYGRRPVLLCGLTLYALTAIFSALAFDLTSLLVTRFIQGFAAGAPRVIVGAAARDCYDGRRLARVMSLVMTIFMIAPVVAPALGQGVLMFADWRAIFGVLFVYSMIMLVFTAKRFPETLVPAKRRPIRPRLIAEAAISVFGNRQTVGYTLAAGSFFGSLFGFIATSQQLMAGVYGMGLWFPIAFAAMALSIALASFVNSLLVERLGMRFLSHIAVIGFCILSGLLLCLSIMDWLSATTFMLVHGVNMLLVGLVFANFNALALEPQGHIAGVASAFTSAVTVVLGSVIGFYIGRGFDGTATPLVFGLFACGVVTLLVLFVTERGRLFRGRHAPQ